MKNLKKVIKSFNKKSDKGITLIALIITIIILVILAAVSIRAVYNMGIVGHAIDGTQKYASESKREEEEMGKTGNTIDSALAKLKDIQGGAGGSSTGGSSTGGSSTGGTKLTQTEQTALAANKMAELTGNQITNSNLKNNSNIKAVLTGQVPVPTNYTYKEGTATTETLTAEEKAVGKSYGVVITDGNGNEFVWVPVNANESIAPTGENGAFETISETSIAQANIENRKIASVFNGVQLASLDGLKGIMIAESDDEPVEPAVTTKATKRSKTILEGYDRSTPDDTNSYREPALVTDYDLDEENKYYTQAGFTTAQEFADAMVADYNAMVASIIKYGGFYVGRYELSGTNNGGSAEITNVKVQANQTPINNVNWYRLYQANRKFNTSSTTSTMIWGSQWDIVCLWAQRKGDQTSYSEYDSNRHSGDYSASTGSNSNDKRNNIYDLEGSRYEWTQEAYSTDYRTARGGNHELQRHLLQLCKLTRLQLS